MVLVAYITGHGFGHFTRSAAVLEQVARHAEVHVRTSRRALGLARAAGCFASVTEVDVGAGVAQRGPLDVDLDATRAALEAHLAAWPELVDEEARALRAIGARLVFADVPPLAFAAAARAGVPSVGMGNFSWSWIYEGYAERAPWFAGAAARLAAAEAQATLFLELAMGGGLDRFPRRVAIDPVARRPTRSRAEARALLPFAVDDPRPIVLVSFGGFGEELDLPAAARALPLRLLVVSAQVAQGENVRSIEPRPSLPHQDLTLAVDCILGKPGYGTVAECLVGPTPMVHVPRGDFREAPALVSAIERWLPSGALSTVDFRAGRWAAAVERALVARPACAAPTGDGAAQAAALLLERLS